MLSAQGRHSVKLALPSVKQGDARQRTECQNLALGKDNGCQLQTTADGPLPRAALRRVLSSVLLCRESCSRQTPSLPRAGLCQVRHSAKASLPSARQKALGKASSTRQSPDSGSADHRSGHAIWSLLLTSLASKYLQGRPIVPPMSFILAMDVLNLLITRANELGLLQSLLKRGHG